MIRVLSFDVWNTLLDIDKFYQILSVKISSEVGRPYDEIYKTLKRVYRDAISERLSGGFKRIIIDSGEYFAEGLGIDLETLFRALVRTLLDEEIRDLAYEDVLDTLKDLKKRGFLIGVVSNVMFWPGMIVRYLLHMNNLLEFFNATVFSDEIGFMKPEKEIFEYLAKRFNVKLEEIVHVGDSLEHDLVGALRAGVRSVLVKRDLEADFIRLSRRAYVIRGLRHLWRVLEDIGSDKTP
ncbi:MAG: HAD family hydrolase [Sulfolobales archaeon]